mmetsp:Transcript_73703/g.199346  ORF Transcript_73703/g.199346 Transcript_73703/m.199346 type:complete len:346 (+) Transcript_73703:444-1481(+)
MERFTSEELVDASGAHCCRSCGLLAHTACTSPRQSRQLAPPQASPRAWNPHLPRPGTRKRRASSRPPSRSASAAAKRASSQPRGSTTQQSGFWIGSPLDEWPSLLTWHTTKICSTPSGTAACSRLKPLLATPALLPQWRTPSARGASAVTAPSSFAPAPRSTADTTRLAAWPTRPRSQLTPTKSALAACGSGRSATEPFSMAMETMTFCRLVRLGSRSWTTLPSTGSTTSRKWRPTLAASWIANIFHLPPPARFITATAQASGALCDTGYRPTRLLAEPSKRWIVRLAASALLLGWCTAMTKRRSTTWRGKRSNCTHVIPSHPVPLPAASPLGQYSRAEPCAKWL